MKLNFQFDNRKMINIGKALNRATGGAIKVNIPDPVQAIVQPIKAVTAATDKALGTNVSGTNSGGGFARSDIGGIAGNIRKQARVFERSSEALTRNVLKGDWKKAEEDARRVVGSGVDVSSGGAFSSISRSKGAQKFLTGEGAKWTLGITKGLAGESNIFTNLSEGRRANQTDIRHSYQSAVKVAAIYGTAVVASGASSASSVSGYAPWVTKTGSALATAGKAAGGAFLISKLGGKSDEEALYAASDSVIPGSSEYLRPPAQRTPSYSENYGGAYDMGSLTDESNPMIKIGIILIFGLLGFLILKKKPKSRGKK